MKLLRDFKEKFWAAQLARPSGWFGQLIMGEKLNQMNESMNRRALRVLAPVARDRILEVGFGGGDLLSRILAADDSIHVTGLELSDAMVAAARKRFASDLARGRLDLELGPIEKIPAHDEAFSAICTVNTIYFWRNTRVALRECHRVLQRGGRIVICFNPKEELEKDPAHKHGFRLYTVADVERMLYAAGFNDTAVTDDYDLGQGTFYCVSAVKK